MRIVGSGLLAVCVLSGIGGNARAIATDNDNISAENPLPHGYDLNWDYVYRYKTSSSVAVDHYWILTAAHVADDGGSGTLSVGGETYTSLEIVFHPTADLALVRYDKPFPGYYPLHDGLIHNGKSGPRQVWDELVVVGFGYPGDVTTQTFSQSGTPGAKRWGTNRGEGVSAINIDVAGTAGYRSTQCIQTSFLLSDTSHEAGANVFDSGGALFIERESVWRLAGINLYRAGGNNVFTGNGAAHIPDYIGWIKSVIVDYDTDMDGLPDWWETQYTGNSTAMAAADDPDGDGFTNYEEWIADTIPDSSSSCLRMMPYTNMNEVVFSSSTQRQYRIEYRTSLGDTNEVWQTEVDWFDPVSTQTVREVSSSPSARYYRIRARL